MKLLIFIVGFALVIASLSCQLQKANAVYKSSVPTTKLHFPQPWLDQMNSATYIEQIEVRKLPNSLGNEFFFGALPNGDNFYADEVDQNLPKPRYGDNTFAVKFADGPQVRVASQQEWERVAHESGPTHGMLARKVRTIGPERSITDGSIIPNQVNTGARVCCRRVVSGSPLSVTQVKKD